MTAISWLWRYLVVQSKRCNKPMKQINSNMIGCTPNGLEEVEWPARPVVLVRRNHDLEGPIALVTLGPGITTRMLHL